MPGAAVDFGIAQQTLRAELPDTEASRDAYCSQNSMAGLTRRLGLRLQVFKERRAEALRSGCVSLRWVKYKPAYFYRQ